MGAATIGSVQRPPQEVLDDAQAVVECSGIGRRSIGVGAKFGRKRLDLTAIQDLARGQEGVQIEPGSLLRPDIKTAENSKVAYERRRLDSVSAESDRPPGRPPNRRAGRGREQRAAPTPTAFNTGGPRKERAEAGEGTHS